MKTEKKYSLIFWCGFVCNKDNQPKLENDKTIDEFNSENGYDEQEIENIKNLSVGQMIDVDGIFERMSVYRYQ